MILLGFSNSAFLLTLLNFIDLALYLIRFQISRCIVLVKIALSTLIFTSFRSVSSLIHQDITQ